MNKAGTYGTAMRVGRDTLRRLDRLRVRFEREHGLRLTRTTVAEAAIRLGLGRLEKNGRTLVKAARSDSTPAPKNPNENHD